MYPTKQQTGTELFELVHSAAANFSRVALYFENSLLAPDLPLLPSASAAVTRIERAGTKLSIDSMGGVGVPWNGPALVDGRLWPAADGTTVWLPSGAHTVEPASGQAPARLLRLNGELRSARALPGGPIEFSYRSDAHAIAIFDRQPRQTLVDGAIFAAEPAGPNALLLPRGEHAVTISFD